MGVKEIKISSRYTLHDSCVSFKNIKLFYDVLLSDYLTARLFIVAIRMIISGSVKSVARASILCNGKIHKIHH